MFGKGKNSTNDISNPSNDLLEKSTDKKSYKENEKVIIVDKERKRKVRRRVKKGTKDEVLLERKKKKEEEKKKNQQNDFGNKYNNLDEVNLDDLENAIISNSDKDSEENNPLGGNHQVNRVFNKKANKYHKLEDDIAIEDIDDIKLGYKSQRTESKDSKKGEEKTSHFRDRAIEWRDDSFDDYGSSIKNNSFEASAPGETVAEKSLFVSPIFWVAAVILIGIFVAGGFSASSYAKLQATENKKASFERLITYEASGAEAIAMQVESIEAPLEYEEVVTETEEKVLSLVLSSVEKDLKIKLVNNEDTLVRNIPWSVTIADEKGNESVESDDDQDGIIHLSDIKAGEYSVELIPSEALAEYEYPREKQLVSVKAKIEYKVIQNIKEEIKTEKEVNAAVEDQKGKQAADVETGPVNTDTVEWLESSQVGNGEEYVEAVPDLTKTASIKKENKFLLALKGLKDSVKVNPLKNGFLATIYSTLSEEPAHEHEYSEWVSLGNGSHIRKCNSCGNFESGSCDYQGKSKCSICGAENPDGGNDDGNNGEHVCSLSYDLFDDEDHFVICLNEGCVKYPDMEKHSFDSNGKCTKCGYEKSDDGGDSSGHVHDFVYKSKNDGTHTVKCKADGCPGKYETVENCTSTTETCTKCGFTPLNHDHTYEYKSNNDGTHNATCMCGLTIKNKACEYEGGKCKYCGYVNKGDGNYSDDAQLYDASKNALYVKDGDSYRLAKYADYKSGNYTTFYRRADSYLYTGWQDIDGKRYYYLSDHTYVTGDQIIGGILYHFASDGALSQGSGTLGIDVSKYQPSINWQSVKASGVNYVIIRCGYRGSSTGVLIEDPCFKSHIKGAKAAGLKVGVYFFTTAVTEAEAVEEASMCAYLCQGYGIDYPVFMDCESSSRPGYNGMSASQRTEIIKAFCNTIRSAGYTPGVYANKTWLSSYMSPGSLGGARIWLAQYNSDGPTYSGHYDIWQYTSKGKVDGISGYVDMNQSYLGY